MLALWKTEKFAQRPRDPRATFYTTGCKGDGTPVVRFGPFYSRIEVSGFISRYTQGWPLLRPMEPLPPRMS